MKIETEFKIKTRKKGNGKTSQGFFLDGIVNRGAYSIWGRFISGINKENRFKVIDSSVDRDTFFIYSFQLSFNH